VTNDAISVINGGPTEKHIYFAQNLFCIIYNFPYCNQEEILSWPFEIHSSTPPFMLQAFCVTSGINLTFIDLLQMGFLLVARTVLVCISSVRIWLASSLLSSKSFTKFPYSAVGRC